MKRPSPAILGSIALHAGVVGIALVSWPRTEPEIPPSIASVPVTIVSSVEIAAAPADNPSEEVVEDDAATAPVSAPEAQPEPTPAPPAPTPVPPRPTPPPPTPRPVTKAPAPRPAPTPAPAPKKATPTPPRPAPTPPRAAPTPAPTPPRATPPRTTPAPARPAAKSDAPPLDLDALAGPSRPSTNRGPRPATGQQGAGRAPQATGPEIQAILRQVIPNWTVNCDIPGARELRVRVSLTLSADGRITDGPTLISPQSSPVYRATADNALRAIRQTAPFNVPAGFEGAVFNPTFNVETACANQ
ncbi:hypothetical protein [Brevundimonas variabilis]|uniref:Outer membrane biosynthesis protein TonB n=1 Tax=Brevundimonas variabilis TaxID=74312 RepID=A0A7W9CF08_9CAUL|nr:hypothetical protein [Brevundimonas variabilis]MBB5744443.1 outer membrane biosynthesis protein TonB [Brevundimonas variabilis]